MNTLKSSAAYGPKAPHGVKPYAAYSVRAGANSAGEPVSRLSRAVAPAPGLGHEVVEQRGAPTPRRRCAGRGPHRLELAVRRVELAQGGAPQHLVAVPEAPEGQVRGPQPVEVEGVHALGWGVAPHVLEVLGQQGGDLGRVETAQPDRPRRQRCQALGAQAAKAASSPARSGCTRALSRVPLPVCSLESTSASSCSRLTRSPRS